MSLQDRFRELFEEHYRSVARFVRTRGHGSGEADELVARTFEIAWDRLETIPEGRAARPWLLGVARNLSRNARRSSRREASFLDELPSVMLPWAELPIEDRIAGAEVIGAIARLKPVDRDLVLLVGWDELTPAEAGEVLGLRPVTARSRLHRARGRLKVLLEESAALDVDTPRPSLTAQENAHGR